MGGSGDSGWQLAVDSYREVLWSGRMLVGFVAVALLWGPRTLELLTFLGLDLPSSTGPVYTSAWWMGVLVVALADARSTLTHESLGTAMEGVASDRSALAWVATNLGVLVLIALLFRFEPSVAVVAAVQFGLLPVWTFFALPTLPLVAGGHSIPVAVKQGTTVALDERRKILCGFAAFTALYVLAKVVALLGNLLVGGGAMLFVFGGAPLVPLGLGVTLLAFVLLAPLVLAFPRFGVSVVQQSAECA